MNDIVIDQQKLLINSNIELKELLDFVSTHIIEYYIFYDELLIDTFFVNYEKNEVCFAGRFPFMYGSIISLDIFNINRLHIKLPTDNETSIKKEFNNIKRILSVDYFEQVLNNIKELKK